MTNLAALITDSLFDIPQAMVDQYGIIFAVLIDKTPVVHPPKLELQYIGPARKCLVRSSLEVTHTAQPGQVIL